MASAADPGATLSPKKYKLRDREVMRTETLHLLTHPLPLAQDIQKLSTALKAIKKPEARRH